MSDATRSLSGRVRPRIVDVTLLLLSTFAVSACGVPAVHPALGESSALVASWPTDAEESDVEGTYIEAREVATDSGPEATSESPVRWPDDASVFRHPRLTLEAPASSETTSFMRLLGYPDDEEKGADPAEAEEARQKAASFSDDKWHFAIMPYGWIPAIRARVGSSDINIHTSDIIDDLDFAYMLSVEARRNRWGFFVDSLRMDLTADKHVDFFSDPRATLRLSEGIIQSGVYYRFGNEKMYLDAMASVRFYYLRIRFRLANRKTTFRESWFESAIGLRGFVRLTDRWSLAARGDVGGFSLGEASQFTWQGMGFIGFHVSESVKLFGGYRFYSINYNEGFDFKERIMGPVVGAAIHF